MTAAWAAVLIAALALSGGALAAVLRLTVRWTRLEERIGANTTRMGQLVEALRDDRAATNARLTWLERNVTLRTARRPRGGDDSGP